MTKMNELYEKVAKDEALQEELAEIMKIATDDNVAEIQGKLIDFAKRQGYDVTEEEISAFFGGMAQASQELDDDALDAVAGGKSDEGKTLIVSSALTVGILCGAISGVAEAVKSISGANCKSYFQ